VNVLAPHSAPAHDIAALFWWMLAAAVVVFAGTTGFLGVAFVRRRRSGMPVFGESDAAGRGLVLLFGIAIPIVVLIAVFTIANFAVAAHTDGRARGGVEVDVTGHQWWWEVSYPGTGAVTANEIHIPAGRRVNVVVRSADVIHSFWIPELNRKIDLIPGTVNHVSLRADRPGRYYGQCAEYCGVQHAHMRMVVVAEPPARFAAWERAEGADSVAPATPAARRGERVFASNACASCHRLRGTRAAARIGPDLTHLMSRASLAALTIPNTRGALAEWIRDPQHVKPGNRMPGLNLSERDYADLLAYLRGLK
jgi:cytochrome c oxidase subunit 2